MRRFLLLPAIGALVLAGCGGSSGPSEEDAEALLREHGGYAVECVKSTNGSDRDFDCSALGKESNAEVKLGVTVGESGDSIFITHCEPVEKTLSEPCEEIG